jgi:NitT/TauT family transport system substrate-binding protein
MRRRMAVALVALLGVIPAMSVQAAETREVRIAQQFGLSYLPVHVVAEQKLVEKHARAMGLGDVKMTLAKLGSGAAMNDALISGAVDVGFAGTTLLLNVWDKSRGGKGDIRGMMAICDSPIYFNTIDPRIKSLRDFREGDRVAMTSPRGTHHALVWEMAAAREFGWENRARLNSMGVALPHPEAMAALLSGKHEVKTHAATIPFIQQELADPRVRTVLNSYDISGGRHTLLVAYNALKWKTENPKTYAAVVAAFEEAMKTINADKRAAAELYLRFEKSKLSVDEIHKMLLDENMVYFSSTPAKVMLFAEHLMKTGQMQNKAASWKDFFFENVHDKPGS